MALNFLIGQEYKRSDIHDRYGGSRQNGISSSRKQPAVFIFTGETGEQYGYADEWVGDLFYYTGHGQIGDMRFINGNKAIRDHVMDGRGLFLFETTKRSHVRFVGQLVFVDYEYFLTPDRDGRNRRGIRFVLRRADNNEVEHPHNPAKAALRYSLPDKTSRKGLVTSRVGQGWYRQALLEKFDRRCAATGIGVEEILVASHIVPWAEASDTERLDPENGILLSPNYDALFDRHMISFDAHGSLINSEMLDIEALISLGIDPATRIEVTEGMQPYLSRHRDRLRR